MIIKTVVPVCKSTLIICIAFSSFLKHTFVLTTGQKMYTKHLSQTSEFPFDSLNFQKVQLCVLVWISSCSLKFISFIFIVLGQNAVDVLARNLLTFPFDWCVTQTVRSMAPFTGYAEINTE